MTPHPRIGMPLLLAAMFLAGCSRQPESRPSAGDVVTPECKCPPSWKEGGSVILSVMLRVAGPNDTKPLLLKHEDVPLDDMPKATLTFWRGVELLHTIEDLPIPREC